MVVVVDIVVVVSVVTLSSGSVVSPVTLADVLPIKTINIALKHILDIFILGLKIQVN